MAIADMFLKVSGVTGESVDAEHKGEIQVVSWSWGVQGSPTLIPGGQEWRAARWDELEVVKRADVASPVLMLYLVNRKPVTARLTVRKAGQKPLEYFVIDLMNARVVSFKIESEGNELVERVRFSFARVCVTYTPQDAKGGPGPSTVFEHNVEAK